MGIIQSTLGPVKQKVGDLRFSSWKGKNIVARQPASYNDANTPVQQMNRSKFRVATELARKFLSAIRIGFKTQANGKTQANVFVSKLLKAALHAPTITTAAIRAAKISQGVLKALQIDSFVWDSTLGEINISMTDNSNGVDAFPDDSIIVVLHHVPSGTTLVSTGAGTRDMNQIKFGSDDFIGFVTSDMVCNVFAKQTGSNNVSTSQAVI
jgi:hypothetical protein